MTGPAVGAGASGRAPLPRGEAPERQPDSNEGGRSRLRLGFGRDPRHFKRLE